MKYNTKLIGHTVEFSVTKPHVYDMDARNFTEATGGEAIASSCLELGDC